MTEKQELIHCPIITASRNAVYTCRSKKRTYSLLKEYPFVPRTFATPDEVDSYPVFVKPDIGQGAQGTRIIRSKEDLVYALKQNNGLLICEYLPGEEFTIDCFTDKEGVLLSTNIRSRSRIRNGISVSSHLLPMKPEIQEMARIINQKLSFYGAWFFQVKKDRFGLFKLLEIAPRIAGTMGLTRNLGINYPLLTLFTHMDIPVSAVPNRYTIEVDRALISRYRLDIQYDTVYVDLDDTLIVRGRVNCTLIAFLYQCINLGKKIILLTKHIKNVHNTLAEHRISESLFDSILVLPVAEEKSNYVEKDSIFIDDSFSERKKVRENCQVPVFDCSEVEALLDWRE